MLARLQRSIALGLFLSAAAWAIVAVQLGHFFLASAGTVLILLGYALFLAMEFLMLRVVQNDAIAPRPAASQLVRAWWGEVLTAPAVFLWRQPFRANAEPDNTVAVSRVHGIVLVHGFVCNRAFWNPWMRALRAANAPFIAINLEPLFCSIDDYSDRIEKAVASMEATTNLPVVLVGHSMGGIAIRAWLATANMDARVRRVITIGSPHHGAWLARFGRTHNGRQMRQRSPWLATLASRESGARYSLFTCFFGHCDNIVFPAESATLPGARNIHITATAHVCMAFDRAVLDEVRRWLPVEPVSVPGDRPCHRG
jgi:triacylglycerol lipase